MVKSKSQNKRLSGSKNDVLDGDSNVVDSDDPLWYDRTAVRPSKSQSLSKDAAAVLNPDSSVHSSQLSDKWYDHLSQSESSRLQAEALKTKTSSKDIDRAESESEQNVQKRRANFKSVMKQTNKSDNSNPFTRALEETPDSSQSTPGNPKAFRKPGPRFTKIARNDTNSLDSASGHVIVSQNNVSGTISKPGSRITIFGEYIKNNKRKHESISPRRTPSQSTVSQSSSHSSYRIVESSTSSDDEILTPSHSRWTPEAVEKTRSKKVTSTKRKNIRKKWHKRDTSLSFFKSTAEHEKSREAEISNSQTLSLQSIATESRADEAASKSNSSKQDESDKLQPPSFESSDEEIYTPTAKRTQQKKTDASEKPEKSNGKANKSKASKSISNGSKDKDDSTSPVLSKRKPRKRLFREKRTSEVGNAFDQISFSASSSGKDKSKDKEAEHTQRVSQQSQTVANTSQKRQSASASKNQPTSRQSSAEVSDGEKSGTTSTTERLQRLRKRLFERSNDSSDDDLDVPVDVFEGGLEVENVPENRSGLSQTSRKSTKKDSSTVREAPARESLSKIARLTVPTGIEKNQLSSRKSPVVSGSSKPASNAPSDRRSVETSTDGTMITVSPRATSTPMPSPVFSRGRPSAVQPGKPSSAAKSTHDSSHTPTGPVQSTLKPHDKRLTLFSFSTTDDDSDEERAPIAQVSQRTSTEAGPSAPREDDDAFDESNLPPHLRRFLNVPFTEKDQEVEKNVNESETPIDWNRAKKHTDDAKARAIAQLRVAEENRRKLELQKQRINEGFRRLQARKEYRRKLRKKKPVDKAFLVDGEVYKPPKLPRPKPWATDKLYDYLSKCMQKKCGLRTKVKSERFVVRLAEFATMIAKRRKYEKYADELEELMVTMAKLGIIETRCDFYRFCVEFMPYSFREKVVPMAVPGNKRSIPYFPALTSVPLVNEEDAQEKSDSEDL